ncbi:MAG: DUF2062 domain-containing protein [Blastocatellia bacterium]|nr:DUF2062 domain-containing protein [Blastocatellia bacterium]MCS7157681.1 DUF2062 domain-containing protein [Blastocatellia bacterium]MCX7751946.1 DUF2062 domain-containing protein [Blastocatellia bacterium]MDW8167052.1 DUF2062 domain-containing protein [Acidobacteriota bacterium]MDW8257156.1 DUF2062 domain-containing protein [Acidobacteriota bacterium]
MWKKVLRFVRRALRSRASPREIAGGLALGLVINFTPTLGFQIPLAISLSTLFRVNSLAALAGIQITNPLTAPFVYTMTYRVGTWLLGQRNHRFEWRELDAMDLIRAGAALWAGGLVVGGAFALLAYFAVLWFLTRWRTRRALQESGSIG